MSFPPKVPLPPPPESPVDDGYFNTESHATRWPVAEIIELPFSAPAAAGYVAYRCRRLAGHLLLVVEHDILSGYASQLEVLAEDLEHAFHLPPPGLAS